MRLSLLLVTLAVAPLVHAQSGTFTFSTAVPFEATGSSVTETAGGVTLSITATGGGASTLGVWDYGTWKGTNSYVVANDVTVSSLVLSFSSPVNVAGLRFADGFDNSSTGTYVFTPSAGTPFVASDTGSGVTVAPAGGFQNITSLTITRQNGTAFYFALDDVVMDATLPVELVSFGATADGRSAVLAWRTASETNNAGFDVQQQRDGAWTTLGFVAGAGTSLEGHAYAFRADALAPGTYRFRLKQLDFDGTYAFSPEVELALAPHHATLSLPPTFTGVATIHLTVERSQRVRVLLFDALGRAVRPLFDGQAEGALALPLDGTSLPAGVYFVRAQGKTFEATRQTVLVR